MTLRGVRTNHEKPGIAPDSGLKVPVITYHSIDESGSVISTSPEVFRRQMEFLSGAGYRTITLSELVSSLRDAEAVVPANTVVLTFDDGFRNFYSEAFPVLSDHGFNATVFVVTDFCGRHNDWAGNPADFPRSELLSWREIKELAGCGVDFGSHTRSHPDLTELSAAEMECEIVESKHLLADALGRETRTFAYPFGRSTPAIRQRVREHYDAACSTDLGKVTVRSDPASLKRIDSYYLADRRILEKISSRTFDNYMLLRQAGRGIRSLFARP